MDPDDVPRRYEGSPVAAPTSSTTDLTAAVRVTDLLGRQVLGTEGAPLGRLEDVTILHGDARPEVHRILLRATKGHRAVDGGLVELVDGPSFTARRTPDDLDERDTEAGTTELRLAADVLDAQIVDLTGHHIVRVGDVLIADIDDRLLVVAVEVDAGAVLRRLGLGPPDPHPRRPVGRTAPDVPSRSRGAARGTLGAPRSLLRHRPRPSARTAEGRARR